MLIATDLDGTFLDPDGGVSPRNLRALDSARAAGVEVVPVTGRALGGLRRLGPLFPRHAVLVNGALGYDLVEGRATFTQPTPAEVVSRFVEAMDRAAEGIVFCSVVGDSGTFLVEDGYDDLTPDYERHNDPADLVVVSRAQLVATDSLKIMARHPRLSAEQLHEVAEDLALPQVHTTFSGYTMVEMSRAGVAKDSGLERLCAVVGQRREDVVALGDGSNDVEMLAWAGSSYAMAKAHPRAVAAADHRAPDHAEDGFARVVEELLAERGACDAAGTARQ